MESIEERTAGGFLFCTRQDAQLAAQEQRKIEYLQERMHYSNPESILRIYEKAVAEKIFQTPVGIGFLKELQGFLKKNDAIENGRIPPIPIQAALNGEPQGQADPLITANAAKKNIQKKSAALPVSILLNIVLLMAVAGMFWIALGAGQPNILNYEEMLLNRYAGWEQELTEREQAIREKELLLSQ